MECRPADSIKRMVGRLKMPVELGFHGALQEVVVRKWGLGLAPPMV